MRAVVRVASASDPASVMGRLVKHILGTLASQAWHPSDSCMGYSHCPGVTRMRCVAVDAVPPIHAPRPGIALLAEIGSIT